VSQIKLFESSCSMLPYEKERMLRELWWLALAFPNFGKLNFQVLGGNFHTVA
jgi:hypothetical protein